MDAAEILAGAEERIVRHRTAEVRLRVLGPDGRPVRNRQVTVRQVRHRFLFGCNAYALGRCGDAAAERAYRRRFAALLNYATLPFYWGGYEPAEGDTQGRRLAAMARWCAARGIRAKGHPLCWHEVVPAWLPGRALDEVRRLQLGRIARDVGEHRRAVAAWDVVNEAVVMPRYPQPDNPVRRLCRRLGRVRLIGECFAAARRAAPRATLLLNDYDTTPAYERLLGDCLDAGVEIDAVGIQSHMHKGYWGAEKAWEVCELFARFGRPLHFTELTILSGRLKTDNDWHTRRTDWPTDAVGERRQAEQAAELYTVLFSHPAVEAITWWDFSDRSAWQGAPSGLVRADMSPKPAYEALRRLVRGAWWTGPLKRTTDAAGRVAFRGFLGDYALRAGQAAGAFRLGAPGRRAVTVRLEGRP